jgi:hypothetical protein
LEQEELK